MPINVKCHKCDKPYRLNDSLAGKKFKCKQCEAIVLATPIPVAPAPKKRSAKSGGQSSVSRPAASVNRTAGPAKKKRPATAPPVRRKKKPAPEPYAEEYDDDFADDYGDDFSQDYDDGYDPYGAPPAPKKKKSSGKSKTKKKKSSSGGGLPSMTFNLNRINAILVVGGGMLMFIGCQEMRLSNRAGSTPKAITLQELSTDGPGTDVYFTVSGVVPVNEGFVYEEAAGDRFSAIWYAARPVESPNNSSNFIVYSRNAPTESDVGALMLSQTHTGMVVNSIQKLDKETKGLLRQNLPGIDVETALIFQVGRTPAGIAKYGSMLLGGLVLALAGLAWLLFVHD